MPNLQNLAAASAFSGLKNDASVSFSAVITGQTLTAGAFVSVLASTPLTRTNSVSQVQVQYSGVQTDWNVVYGSINNYFAGGNYEIESLYYFDATKLNVFTVVANQTGGNVAIPTITINCKGFLYLAPF